MIRRFGDPPRVGIRYHPRPGAYAILIRGDRVLLTWQGGIHNEFQLPGGGIDPGENPVPALHREVYEETGWHMDRPRRLGAHRRHVYMPEYDKWAEKIGHIYLARPTRRLGPPLEPDHEPAWTPLAFAADLVAHPGDAAFLALVRDGLLPR